MYGATDQAFATAYYHWFFLIQPFDLPETADRLRPRVLPAPENSAAGRSGLRTSSIRARSPNTSAASADPATIHASCEDYRAAASIDLEHDEADVAAGPPGPLSRSSCCGATGVVINRMFDPLRDWGAVAGGRSRTRASVRPLSRGGSACMKPLRELRAFFAASPIRE